MEPQYSCIPFQFRVKTPPKMLSNVRYTLSYVLVFINLLIVLQKKDFLS